MYLFVNGWVWLSVGGCLPARYRLKVRKCRLGNFCVSCVIFSFSLLSLLKRVEMGENQLSKAHEQTNEAKGKQIYVFQNLRPSDVKQFWKAVYKIMFTGKLSLLLQLPR